jgi:hypothetical protein
MLDIPDRSERRFQNSADSLTSRNCPSAFPPTAIHPCRSDGRTIGISDFGTARPRTTEKQTLLDQLSTPTLSAWSILDIQPISTTFHTEQHRSMRGAQGLD